jgi:hypothetical protein
MAAYVLNDEKMFCDIADGIAIIINSETGIYYGLNAFGTAVLEKILNGVETADIQAALAEMPGAPGDMPARLADFLQILQDKELIRPGPAGPGGLVDLSREAAEKESFALEIKEYNDAQELLLADPIHEVKENTGWRPDKEALETDKEKVREKEAKMER